MDEGVCTCLGVSYLPVVERVEPVPPLLVMVVVALLDKDDDDNECDDDCDNMFNNASVGGIYDESELLECEEKGVLIGCVAVPVLFGSSRKFFPESNLFVYRHDAGHW